MNNNLIFQKIQWLTSIKRFARTILPSRNTEINMKFENAKYDPQLCDSLEKRTLPWLFIDEYKILNAYSTFSNPHTLISLNQQALLIFYMHQQPQTPWKSWHINHGPNIFVGSWLYKVDCKVKPIKLYKEIFYFQKQCARCYTRLCII